MCQDAYGKQIERNISFFKPLPFLRPDVTNGDAEPDDTIDNMESNNTNDDTTENESGDLDNTPSKKLIRLHKGLSQQIVSNDFLPSTLKFIVYSSYI